MTTRMHAWRQIYIRATRQIFVSLFLNSSPESKLVENDNCRHVWRVEKAWFLIIFVNQNFAYAGREQKLCSNYRSKSCFCKFWFFFYFMFIYLFTFFQEDQYYTILYSVRNLDYINSHSTSIDKAKHLTKWEENAYWTLNQNFIF